MIKAEELQITGIWNWKTNHASHQDRKDCRDFAEIYLIFYLSYDLYLNIIILTLISIVLWRRINFQCKKIKCVMCNKI